MTYALGGASLLGDDMTHFAYLDEAGITSGDPIAVEAGIILDSRMTLELQEYIRGVMHKLTPQPWPPGFVISAKDLFHGTRSFKDDIWLERRGQILHELLAIPAKFSIPVILGWSRNSGDYYDSLPPKKRTAGVHASAFILCAIMLEQFMWQRTRSRSVATMIVENNTETMHLVRATQRRMRLPTEAKEGLPAELHAYLPLRKVIEDPLFAEKSWSVPLLIADACAFTFARWFAGRSGAEPLMSALMGSGRPHFSDDQGSGNQYFIPEIISPLKTLTPGGRFGND